MCFDKKEEDWWRLLLFMEWIINCDYLKYIERRKLICLQSVNIDNCTCSFFFYYDYIFILHTLSYILLHIHSHFPFSSISYPTEWCRLYLRTYDIVRNMSRIIRVIQPIVTFLLLINKQFQSTFHVSFWIQFII